jgi:hypothetical protein
LKIRVNDKVGPANASFRSSPRCAHANAGHQSKTSDTLSTLLCFEAATPGSHFTPRGIWGKSAAQKEERFFEGEVMWSKLYQPHKILSSLQLQKNDASPRTKFKSENKTFRGRAKYKTKCVSHLTPVACALSERSE